MKQIFLYFIFLFTFSNKKHERKLNQFGITPLQLPYTNSFSSQQPMSMFNNSFTNSMLNVPGGGNVQINNGPLNNQSQNNVDNFQFRLPDLEIQEQCFDKKKQIKIIVQEVWKQQQKHLFKEIEKFLEQNKYQVAMSEIKLTRNLRMQLNALMNTFSNVSLNNIDFVDSMGNSVNSDKEYINSMQNSMLQNGDMSPM